MRQSNDPNDALPSGWQAFYDASEWLKARFAVTNGPSFILNNFDCKYINARIDMRTGQMQIVPGNIITTIDESVIKDAERYRWLRDNDMGYALEENYIHGGEDLDKFCDTKGDHRG